MCDAFMSQYLYLNSKVKSQEIVYEEFFNALNEHFQRFYKID